MRRYTGPPRLSSGAATARRAAKEHYRLLPFMINVFMKIVVQPLLRLPFFEPFSIFPAFLFPDIPTREGRYCHGKRHQDQRTGTLATAGGSCSISVLHENDLRRRNDHGRHAARPCQGDVARAILLILFHGIIRPWRGRLFSDEASRRRFPTFRNTYETFRSSGRGY